MPRQEQSYWASVVRDYLESPGSLYRPVG